MSVYIPQHIQSLTPYTPGKPISELARERGLTHIVKLASNENPLGSSPKALEAARQALADSNRYVDVRSHDLVEALARHHNQAPERIICTSGVDSLLEYIVLAFTDEQEEIITGECAFIGIFVNASKLKRKLIRVPMRDYRYDLDAIAERVSDKTRVIYLASPNNPTGAIITKNELERFLAKVPARVLIVLDEAYYSYAADGAEYHNGLDYDLPNLLVTRTMSKDYGLAGLRVGYGIGQEKIIEALYKVKLPFEPSNTAQCAAIAALDDQEFLQKTLELNRRMMKLISERLGELKIPFVRPYANFVLMIFPDARFAESFAERTLEKGLIIRHAAPFGAANCVRMNSGAEEETEFALQIVADVYTTLLSQ